MRRTHHIYVGLYFPFELAGGPLGLGYDTTAVETTAEDPKTQLFKLGWMLQQSNGGVHVLS